ncbi:MAG: class I SAM-dependent methyltransferase [Actinomycetota bacterium]
MTTTIDQDRAQAFTGRVVNDTAGLTTVVLASIGDRLGLWKALAAAGPATSTELAGRTGTQERYVREWLAAMFAAGYVTYDAGGERFALPAEHAPTLVDEPGPSFFGGVHQEIVGALQRIPALTEAFRRGGGVAQDSFPEDVYIGMDRFTAMWHENLLLQQWLPACPDAHAKLEAGARVADVGCGQGRALIRLVQAYPGSEFVGYDVFAPNVERARANADAAGVAGRVRFELRDAAAGLDGPFDVVTTWDVLHDAVDPSAILTSIRQALWDDGIYLCLDINCSDRLEENTGPLKALLYGISVMYCMTTSLAHGGAGLGTCGLSPRTFRELCERAGFSRSRLVAWDNPFNNLYEARP